VDYHKHIKAIQPTERWNRDELREPGTLESVLVVTTDLALPKSLGHDAQKFADLHKWVEDYRDRRYPNLKIEYRKG